MLGFWKYLRKMSNFLSNFFIFFFSSVYFFSYHNGKKGNLGLFFWNFISHIEIGHFILSKSEKFCIISNFQKYSAFFLFFFCDLLSSKTENGVFLAQNSLSSLRNIIIYLKKDLKKFTRNWRFLNFGGLSIALGDLNRNTAIYWEFWLGKNFKQSARENIDLPN